MRRALFLLPLSIVLAQKPPAGWQDFSIGPAVRNGARFNAREGLRAEGITVRNAISRGWGIPEYLIVGPEWIGEQRYAITALISGAPETFAPLFQQELAKRFHLEAHREKRETSVYVVRTADDLPLRLQESGGGAANGQYRPGSLKLANSSIPNFVRSLSAFLQRPVLDETGIAAARKFDFDVVWEANSPASMAAAFKDKLGLALVETQQAVEFLVVDRIEPVVF